MGFTTIIYAVIVFCLLILVHEFGHFITAKAVGIRVNEFSLGMGPLIFQKVMGETEYSLRLLPIGGFCRMEGEDEESDDRRAFNNKPAWARALVVIAGAFMNLVVAIVILACIAGVYGVATNTVGTVKAGSPAQYAGIQVGDKIISVDGEKVSYFSHITTQISGGKGDKVELVVLREGKKAYLTTGVMKAEDGRRVIGITSKVSKSPANTLKYGVSACYSMGKEMISFVGQLFMGKSSMTELMGPVGIVSAIGEQAKLGFAYVANLAALISLNLAILNLMPFPALDGGRLLFIGINAVTGKAVSDEMEGKIHFVGMMLLLLLMAYVLIQDVVRLF